MASSPFSYMERTTWQDTAAWSPDTARLKSRFHSACPLKQIFSWMKRQMTVPLYSVYASGYSIRS